MAVTNEQISEYLAANPSLSDAEIAAAMMQNKVTPQQVAQVTNLGQDVVQARYDAAKPSPLAQVANTGLGAQDTTSNAATGALAQAAPVYDFSTNLGQYRAIKTGDKDLIAQALAANTQGDVYDRAYLTNVLGKEFANSYFAPPAAVVNDPVVVTEPVVAPLTDQVVSGATQTEGALVRGGDADYYGDADTSVTAAAPAYDLSTSLGQYRAIKSGDKDLIAQALAANTGNDVYDRSFLTSVLGKEFADSYFAPPVSDVVGLPAETTTGGALTQASNNTVDQAATGALTEAEAADLISAFGGQTPDDAGLLAGFKRAKDLGISDDVLKSTLGEDLYNTYEQGLTNFAVTNLTNIVADNKLTWGEAQKIHNFGRDLGFTPEELAEMTGQDKSIFELAETNYKTGRDQIINGTLTSDSVTTDADRIISSIALQKEFGFTDEEIAEATGVDLDVIKSSLNPVRSFETEFTGLFQNTDTTTADAKTFLENARSNAAINKLYGDSLNEVETNIRNLEEKWSSYGTDALQAETLSRQLNAQKAALGGDYYGGIFGDLDKSAALLVNKGLDTINDLGQKDKFETTKAEVRYTTSDGEPVMEVVDDLGNKRFMVNRATGGDNTEYVEIPKDQVNTSYGRNEVVYEGSDNSYSKFVPLTAEEQATLGEDGNYQKKLGTVVIDKDTGKELTGLDGNLLYQRSGGTFTGKKHYLTANFTPEGVPILTTRQEKSGIYGFVSDVAPMALAIASFIPGPHQPFARLANAALALEQKNYIGAVLSGLSAAGSFTGNELATLQAAEASGDVVNAGRMLDLQNTMSNIKLAQTFAQGAAALNANNIPGLINSGISAYAQLGDSTLPSGVTTAVQLGNLGIALGNKQYDVALNSLGDLTGSSDFKIAGAAATLVDAIQRASDTGDFSGVVSAGMGLADVIKAGPSTPPDEGGITNRVVDDAVSTISNDNTAIDAFTAAKNAGATDQEAMDAANAVTGTSTTNLSTAADTAGDGVVINKIPDSESGNVVTTTYDSSAADNEFGNLQGAIETNAMDDAVRADRLNVISNLPKFSDAYSQARTLLGPNQTFTWNGKEYSTATAAERPDLNITSADLAIDALNRTNLATDTDASRTVGAQTDTIARIYGSAGDQSAAETTRLTNQNADLKSLEKTSFLGQIYKDLNEQFRLQGVAANEYLRNNPNSPITNNISTAFEAAANLQKNVAGGAALLLDNKPLADEIVNNADVLARFGQSIGTGPQDTKNWEETVDLVNKAKGFEKVAVVVGRVLDGNSGLGRQVEVELRQELPGMFLGGGSVKGIMLATGAMDVGETAGNAALEAYDEDIKKGKSHEQAMSSARTAGGTAAMTETALQLTLGKLADFGAGKLDNVISKGTAKVAGEGVVEGSQEAGASAAVDLALGNAIDVNKALTQGVLGAAVGKGTAATTSPVDAATTSDSTAVTSTGAATDLGTVGATVPGADVVQGTDLGSIGSITLGGDAVVGGASTLGDAGAAGSVAGSAADISNIITTQLGSGADAAVVIGSTITGAVNSGADVGNVINSTVTSSLDAGASASVVIDSAITSGITGGADASVVISNTVTSAVNSGANVAATVESSVSSAITAGADASTAVGSSVTSVVNSGGNVAVAVDSAVTAAVTAGTDASTAVNSAVTSVVNSGGNVAVAVDSSVAAAITAGTDAAVAVDSAVAAVVNSGGNVTTAVDSAVTAAVNAGSNVTTAVESAVTAAVTAGASVDASVAAAVSSAVNSGANVATVVDAATAAATATGNNVSIASDANVVTISNATTNTTTTVDTTTGVTTSVDSANNVTTVVDGNTSTVVDANANTTSQTTVDANNNTQTTVTVDANTNTNTQTTVNNNTNITTSVTVDANSTTQTTIDANNNTQTTVLTNTDTNTQTTVKVNTDTGDVIEVKETEVPTDWKPPVIDEPKVPEVPVVKTPEDPTKPAVPKLPSLKGSEEQRGGGGFGLPSGINVDPASLRSKVTGGAIDPLARVKQAQAELERDVMMNQLDPRFAAVIQQRTDPQQQAQQYDKDIGALAKLLSGEPSAPANEGKYYSYGSEDSIDSILGGQAANYKEGGFVEPLKASGGMVLPLLAKSGGALGKYSGREDFKGGKHVAGDGDGQSDDIPAWLADGEFVFPADVVSALGNGSTKAGTDKLYAMMHGIRDRARSKGPKDLPPPAFKSPLDYLKSSKRSK